MNKGDLYFQRAIERILNNGIFEDGEVRPNWSDGTPARTIFDTQYIETYDISSGKFPITTVKPTFIKTAIKEILWIYQDKSNNLELLKTKYDVHYWDQWESKDLPGTIGMRYGAVVKKYNLIDNLIAGLISNPLGRRYNMNLNQYECLESTDGLHSCAFETLWSVRGEYLDCTLIQRSNDVVAAFNLNLIQYVALQMMISHSVGLKPGKFTRFIQNIHIYDRHIEIAKEYLNRKPSHKQPKLVFKPKSRNFYDYTIDDFSVEDYVPQKQIKFELAE